MHGSLVHMSYENKSDQSRQAYTLHIVEGPPHATYPADNWYRPLLCLLLLLPTNPPPHPPHQPIDVLCLF
jgi:ectoine hydroxylase-related dioxygenase (phytanoyl-CoA dioxygenase family)